MRYNISLKYSFTERGQITPEILIILSKLIKLWSNSPNWGRPSLSFELKYTYISRQWRAKESINETTKNHPL